MREEMDRMEEAGFEFLGTAQVFQPQRPFLWMMAGTAGNPAGEAGGKALQEYHRIQRLISEGKREEAMAGLEEFLRFFPDHSPAHDDLGVLYFQKGDQNQAGDHFLTSLRTDPKNWNAAKNLADLLVEQGQPEEAFHFYRRVLAERPDDEEALLGVALVCRETGLGEDAEFFYRRVQEVKSRGSAASAPRWEPEDCPAQRTSMASRWPHDPPSLHSTPAREEKQPCFPPSSDLLPRKGKALLEE